MDKKEIGSKISATRKERGLTQKELALATALGISVVELLGFENISSKEIITEMTVISIEEKKSIVKELKNRGWITVIIGLVIWGGMIYTSKILANNGMFGFPQICTAGMSGFIGIIISNGIVSIYKGNKLLK